MLQQIYKFPWKYYSKIAFVLVVVLFIAMVSSVFTTGHYYQKQFEQRVQTDLSETLEILTHTLPRMKKELSLWCQGLTLNDSQYRITLIKATGDVVCDSMSDYQKMDNHLYREEIQQAIKSGSGLSQRFSKTLDTDLYYHAVQLKNGDFLRLSLPLKYVENAKNNSYQSVLLIMLPLYIFVALFFLAFFVYLTNPLRKMSKKIQGLRDKYPQSFLSWPNDDLEEESFSELTKTFRLVEKNIEATIEKTLIDSQKFRTLLESLKNPILAVDNDGRILFFNQAFFKAFLPKSNELLKEYKYENVFAWDLLRNKKLKEIIESPKIEDGQEMNLVLKKRDESEAVYQITLANLFDNNSHIYGKVSVFHDVTEQTKSQKLRENFVANISHEVRTPLTSIRGYLDILLAKKNEIPQDHYSYLEKMAINSKRLMVLFNDILNLSVLETGKQLHIETFSTSQMIEQVVETVKQKNSRKNINYIVTVDSHEFTSDPSLIDQVLINLIDNASKYNHDNGNVEISWKQQLDHAIIKVKDNGPGIAPEHIGRIYERFYRVDSSRSSNDGGTGLGLSIVKHILLQLKATITVDSKVGVGTTFTIKLKNLS